MMTKVVLFLLLIATLVLGLATYVWYDYVNNTTSPYDEVGIEINNMMPGFMRQWGCAQLKANFPNSTPPLGCN